MNSKQLTLEELLASDHFKNAFDKNDMELPLKEFIEKMSTWIQTDSINELLHVETRLAFGRLINGLQDCDLAHSHLTPLLLAQREQNWLVSFNDAEQNEILIHIYTSLYGITNSPNIELPKHLKETYIKIKPLFETVQWNALVSSNPLEERAEVFFGAVRNASKATKDTRVMKLVSRTINVLGRGVSGATRVHTLQEYVQFEQPHKLKQFGPDILDVFEILVLTAGAKGEMIFFTSYRKTLFPDSV